MNYNSKDHLDKIISDWDEWCDSIKSFTYSWWNGWRMVSEDSVALIQKKLKPVGLEIRIEIQVARSKSKLALDATNESLKKIRKIFDILPLKEGGLSELETFQLLDHFITAVEDNREGG